MGWSLEILFTTEPVPGAQKVEDHCHKAHFDHVKFSAVSRETCRPLPVLEWHPLTRVIPTLGSEMAGEGHKRVGEGFREEKVRGDCSDPRGGGDGKRGLYHILRDPFWAGKCYTGLPGSVPAIWPSRSK